MKTRARKRLSKALAIFMTVFMLTGMIPQMAFANEVPVEDIIQQEQQLDDVDQNIDDQVEEQQQQSEPDISNVPVVASEGTGDPVMEDVSGTAYISISDDKSFVSDNNGVPVANKAIDLSELKNIDLRDYSLEGYLYDADGDKKYEITALHLYIYVHEQILGGNWNEDLYITGAAGSIYLAGGLFGFSDENLRYDLNGAYPAVDGWGLTADQIVLKDGDFLNVAHYTDWAFWGDSATGFHYFTDEDGNLKRDYNIASGETLKMGLVRSYSDWNNGGLPAFDPEIGYEVYYGKAYGEAEGRVYSNEEGIFELENLSAGTWYVWADGGYGLENPEAIVSAPAFATVVVKKQPDLKVTLDLADLAEPIYDGGIVNYTRDDPSNFAYIDDTAEAGENCEYVFSAEDYDKYILYVDFYTEGDIVGWSINGKNYFAEDPGDGYLDWELSDNVYAGYGFNYKDENNKEYIEFYLQLGSDENPYNTPGEWVIRPLVLTEEIVETFIAIDEIFADEITLESGDAIAYAWELYNALSDTDKEIADYIFDVKTLLEEAQAEYDQLTQNDDSIVYISISDDDKYVTDGNNVPIANKVVSLDELKTVDLYKYGLDEYLYDADGDKKHEITALHLYIYVHEKILGLDWSDVYITGGPGSTYFANGLFGYDDENLRYDYNGAYPAVDGWGLTADQIVLKDGDFLNVAHYTDWAFWGDSATGFHYFTDEDGSLKHDYNIASGETLKMGLVRSYSDWNNGGLPAFDPEIGYEVYYGTSYGNATGTVATDDSGYADITFPSAGTWYVWADGGYGSENPEAIVSAPAFATVNVTEAAQEPIPDPNQEAANVVEEKISAIGEVTLDSENLINEARTAYDALTEEQQTLVDNYNVLETAESALAGLKMSAAADKTAAAAVDALITAIGTVGIYSGDKIEAAREAYDKLTDPQKNLVENYEVLTAAEATIAELYNDAADVDHKAIYEATGKYLAELGTPSVGSTGGEWMVIDITRAGGTCPEGYYNNVVKYVKENINDKEQLHRSKSTENSRVILGLTSAGYDVTDVAGHNLLNGLTDMTYLKNQGINGPIWALIAFDSHDYDIPAGGDVTRDALIKTILAAQHNDGGWSLSVAVDKPSDPDMTGMALQALAPYYNANADVKAAVDKSLEYLSKTQSSSGGFGSIDGKCTESCAQVIVALTALGINPETDSRFVKNGMSVVDAMCTFAVEGGGFAHVPNGTLNGMATEQGQYALAAYYRMLDGKTSLYDMTDVTIKSNQESGDSNDGTTSGNNKEENKNQQTDNKATTKTITKSASIKLSDNAPTDEQLAQGRENHYCDDTGVDARDNSNDILPWYIELNVVKQEITDDQKAKVREALGGEGEIFMLKDIHFTNTKDGSEWQPTKPIKIKLPMVDIGDYENAIIVHITDDGKMEFIKGIVKDDMIEFEADSFSLYGIVGTNVSINDLLTVEEDSHVVWPWILIGIIALVAIVCLAYRRKREA